MRPLMYRAPQSNAAGGTPVETLESFRAETRAWLEANCPASMRTPMPEDEIVCRLEGSVYEVMRGHIGKLAGG